MLYLNVIKIVTKMFSVLICTSSLIMQQIFFQNQIIEFFNVFSVFIYISLESINIVFLIIKFSLNLNENNRNDIFLNNCETYWKKITILTHFLVSVYNFYVLHLLSENSFSKCAPYSIQICLTFSLIIWNFFFYNIFLTIIEKYYVRKEYKKKISHLNIF